MASLQFDKILVIFAEALCALLLVMFSLDAVAFAGNGRTNDTEIQKPLAT